MYCCQAHDNALSAGHANIGYKLSLVENELDDCKEGGHEIKVLADSFVEIISTS